MNPFSHTGLSISDSLKSVRKSVLIYETIIESLIMAESLKLCIRVETEVFADGKTLVEHIRSGECYGLIFYKVDLRNYDEIKAAVDETVAEFIMVS